MPEPGLKCNADGTTFTVGYEMKKQAVVKCKMEDVKKNQSVKVPHQKGEPTTGLFTIKNYTLCFANGSLAQPIYIIEDKAMAKGTYDYYQVPGFGYSTCAKENFCWFEELKFEASNGSG